MAKIKRENGIVLLIALASVLVVTILANVILNVMINQSRLTHHKVSRIQAYYAALAGVNLALDKLRRADDQIVWPMPDSTNQSYVRRMCRASGTGCDIIDPTLPAVVRSIDIVVSANGFAGTQGPCLNPPNDVPVCVRAKVNYSPQL